MKRMFMLLTGISMALTSMAQDDSTSTEKVDTIRIGTMIIIKKNDPNQKHEDHDWSWKRKEYKPSNLTTNWWVVDIGISQIYDQTNYPQSIANGYLAEGANPDWFNQRNMKSTNVNIWPFMQRLNMYKHVVNLKYGVGIELNNYKYTENIRYNKTITPLVVMRTDTIHKNKLAADYISVPIMLNFNFTPDRRNGFGLSIGVSAGYLYSSRQKINGGSGKQKYYDDYDMRPWKISYVAELLLGPVKIYGSYATQSMFEHALDHTPYNFGFRLSNW
jgi:hypothetical protein